jgi:hypothetical protein
MKGKRTIYLGHHPLRSGVGFFPALQEVPEPDVEGYKTFLYHWGSSIPAQLHMKCKISFYTYTYVDSLAGGLLAALGSIC